MKNSRSRLPGAFGKTLIVLDFDEELTQNNYVKSPYLPDFCIYHVLSFSFQNVIWKTEECHVNKNTELKIWLLKLRF